MRRPLLISVFFFLQTQFIQFDGIFDVFFLGGRTVFIDVHHVFRTVIETERAVQAPAVTRHSLEKVFRRAAHFQFQEIRAAFVDAVHGNGLDALDAHARRNVGYALRNAAALGEDTAVERGVVQRGLLERTHFDVARVQKRLQLLEGQNAVDRALGLFLFVFEFFAGAKAR